ncbi:MAG: LssY C-terminal domain-containing protein [Gemmatimonadaceae bacterium]|nr:LssY C-terminal domain-containing protein [Gemmatimonadaceae bacterium]
MRVGRSRWLLGIPLLGIPLLVITAGAPARRVSVADPVVSVRLLQSVSSDPAHVGRAVHASLLAPLRTADGHDWPAGAVWHGRLVAVDVRHEHGSRHRLRVQWDSLCAARCAGVTAQVSGVDDARESVDSTGWIVGQRAIAFWRDPRTWVLTAMEPLMPAAATLALVAARGVTHLRDRRIALPAGSDLFVRIRAIEGAPLVAAPQPRHNADPQLSGLLRERLPRRALTAGARAAGDWINVVLVGSTAQVEAAFAAAGWDIPERMSTHADLETFLRSAAGRGYVHQPVSAQTLDGRPPDLIFQHVTDTFTQRHHVRIWRAATQFEGDTLWLAAGTHDIGMTVSKVHRNLTHRIDPRIDGERDVIVRDLRWGVPGATLSWVIDVPKQGTIESDGAIAVVRLPR